MDQTDFRKTPVGDPLPGREKKDARADQRPTKKPVAKKPSVSDAETKKRGLRLFEQDKPAEKKKRTPAKKSMASQESGAAQGAPPQRRKSGAGKGAGRFTPAFITRLFIAGTAGVLLITVVMLTATRYLKKDTLQEAQAEAPVALVEFAPLSVFAAQFDTVPEPTATPELVPSGALDVLVDGVPVLAFYSKEEAERVLTVFLDLSAAAPEGELFLSASYECEILFAAASGTAPLMEENAALTLLLNEPSLVPITLKTERRTVDVGTAQRSEQSDALLAKGEHFITQLGTGARTATVTECTYVGGTLASTGDPVSEVVTAARTTLVKNGTYRAKDPDADPEDDEGGMGKSAGDITFTKPMAGAYASYFGTRHGAMHNGVDISAKAGTAVVAPAEGVVIYCGERGDYGFTVDIDHGNGFVSRLTHLENVAPVLHQRVFKGDPIGQLAALADSDGAPHLHYELIIDGIPVNPLYYLPK